MSLSEERAARNEALFREVNERVLELAERYGKPEAREASFICECSDGECAARLELPVQVYEAVRASSRQFVVAPGHEGSFRERVVARHDEYVIVEKAGAAGRIAEQTNPRA
jgi:hypothetical protein